MTLSLREFEETLWLAEVEGEGEALGLVEDDVCEALPDELLLSEGLPLEEGEGDEVRLEEGAVLPVEEG